MTKHEVAVVHKPHRYRILNKHKFLWLSRTHVHSILNAVTRAHMCSERQSWSPCIIIKFNFKLQQTRQTASWNQIVWVVRKKKYFVRLKRKIGAIVWSGRWRRWRAIESKRGTWLTTDCCCAFNSIKSFGWDCERRASPASFTVDTRIEGNRTETTSIL